ncbi:MAG: sensor histidine kinase [Spirochaetia bacterium]|nr:sensor histidine kinase [Spirochaetia bacterium]
MLGFLLLLSCNPDHSRKQIPKAIQGTIDLRNWDFEKDGPLALNGEWEFYWNSMLETQDEIKSQTNRSREFATVPGSWHTIRRGEGHLPVYGYAAYRLKILLRPGEHSLSTITDQMGTACTLAANGEIIWRGGNPGKTQSESQPSYRPALISISQESNELEMIVRCSNYHHALKAGFWNPIEIGSSSAMTSKWEGMVRLDWFAMGSLLIMGLYHLGLFSLRRKDRSALWFGAFCLLLSLRSISVGTYYVSRTLPVEWFWLAAKLDFLSFYVATPVMILFLESIFPDEVKHGWVRVTCILSAIPSVLVLLTPQSWFTLTLTAYEIAIVVVGLYALGCLIIAIKRKRQGARLFFTGFLIFFASVVNDILVQQMFIYGPQISAYGLFIFILCQAFLLSRRFTDAFVKVEQLSEDLESKNKALQLLDKAKERMIQQEQLATIGNMAAGIVHDLKNPMGIIKGSVELADDSSIGAQERRSLLKIIDQEADRMISLVQDLLNYSQGAISARKQSVDLGDYVTRIRTAIEPGMKRKNIDFSLEIDGAETAQIDPDRFLRVLVNIASNAADATHPGGQFKISIGKSSQSVIFTLCDNGPGIPEQIRESLFEPFVTHGKSHGTGLGMAIAKSMVDAHGGRISFKSETGKGTMFTIEVPA